ncbi:WD repeat-containing protein WRAP73-like [Oscarella lobularis]|uniref:WD repeat-containing protein WRAP73-like n=1 Tax=Oscarella lobularis TaxID=121494 RepID=UPI0033133CE2
MRHLHFGRRIMNFSELFKQSNQLCRFSPNGNHVANCSSYRLIVRDAKTLQITSLFTCIDAINHFEWSPDSMFVLCCLFKRAIVQVWSLEQPDWRCKIDEGSSGLTAATWSPDSRHILATADFNLRVTVWSLTDKSVFYMKYPKGIRSGLDFTRDGKFLALAERRDCKDYVSVFACDSWQLYKHFPVETSDMSGIRWSPDGHFLCVWESLLEYGVYIYSIDGRRVAYFSAYQYALGIKSIGWSPSSQFLAVGSYDQKIRLLNNITWKTIGEFTHVRKFEQNDDVVVYKEIEKKSTYEEQVTSKFRVKSQYEVCEGSLTVPTLKPDLDKAHPKVGVGIMAFSNDSQYLATRNDNMPNALWIWDVHKLRQSVLMLQTSSITAFSWDPLNPRLAICTGKSKVYMWSPAGCITVDIPNDPLFHAQSIDWNPSGDALALVSKDQFTVCYLTDV